MTSRREVKEDLIETDEEFRRLWQTHQDHERRLEVLTRNGASAVNDAGIVKGIKVQKLHLKDRMEALIRTRL